MELSSRTLKYIHLLCFIYSTNVIPCAGHSSKCPTQANLFTHHNNPEAGHSPREVEPDCGPFEAGAALHPTGLLLCGQQWEVTSSLNSSPSSL